MLMRSNTCQLPSAAYLTNLVPQTARSNYQVPESSLQFTEHNKQYQMSQLISQMTKEAAPQQFSHLDHVKQLQSQKENQNNLLDQKIGNLLSRLQK